MLTELNSKAETDPNSILTQLRDGVSPQLLAINVHNYTSGHEHYTFKFKYRCILSLGLILYMWNKVHDVSNALLIELV